MKQATLMLLVLAAALMCSVSVFAQAPLAPNDASVMLLRYQFPMNVPIPMLSGIIENTPVRHGFMLLVRTGQNRPTHVVVRITVMEEGIPNQICTHDVFVSLPQDGTWGGAVRVFSVNPVIPISAAIYRLSDMHLLYPDTGVIEFGREMLFTENPTVPTALVGAEGQQALIRK